MNWERYLENYDFIWEGRENLPLSWSEGAYHGNGTLGSLVYFRMDEKGFPTVHLELGNNRVYDRRETRNFWMAKQLDNPRLPIGSLEYDCGGNILDFWMRTSLYHGSAELYLKTEKELLHCIFYDYDTTKMIIIEKKEELLDADIEALIEERKQARKAKNFARADEIRKELADKGIILEDTRQGVTWKRV